VPTESDRQWEIRRAAQEEIKRQLEEAVRLRSVGAGVPPQFVGSTLPQIPDFEVKDVTLEPAVFQDQHLMLRGRVQRMCKTGCWVELGSGVPGLPAIRVAPAQSWAFLGSLERTPAYVRAYGQLKRHKLEASEAQTLNEQAGDKTPATARTEWLMVAEGAELSWPD
jgi:hypothetical protein